MSAKMTSAPPRLPALFRMLWQQTYPEMLRQVSAAGFDDIRLAHWPVLQWPGPDGQRPSVIAERAGTSKQAVNHVLRDLERLGYVELRSDPRDSRARLVELTARGHALVEAMFDAATAAERELESTLTPGQRSELKKTLTALWQRDVFGQREPCEIRSPRAADRLAEGAGEVRGAEQGQQVHPERRADGPSYVLQVWDFMVEVPGADGQPTRLVIRVKNPTLDLPELGETVPVLVNRRRTKAAFDLDDPSISPDARRKLGEQRQKANAAAKKAKFEAKLTERD